MLTSPQVVHRGRRAGLRDLRAGLDHGDWRRCDRGLRAAVQQGDITASHLPCCCPSSVSHDLAEDVERALRLPAVLLGTCLRCWKSTTAAWQGAPRPRPTRRGAGCAGGLSGAVRGGPGGHHHRQRADGDHQAVSLHQAERSRCYTPSAAHCGSLCVCHGQRAGGDHQAVSVQAVGAQRSRSVDTKCHLCWSRLPASLGRPPSSREAAQPAVLTCT